MLIIGGGIAGITSAISLARQGFGVHIVEKDDFLGGRAAGYGCKASDKCTKCGVCLAVDKFKEFGLYPDSIDVLEGSRVVSLEGRAGSFKAKVETSPRYIDPSSCTGCGLCLDVCPNVLEGALRKPQYDGIGRHLAIDPEKCPGIKNRSCTKCADVCPGKAIDFGARSSFSYLKADAVIIATGFEPADPRILPDLGYGRLEGVFSALEVEEILAARGRLHVAGEPVPKRVAFVQCVGSRNLPLGRDYCSEVCCRYAMRMALALERVEPETEITMFYMDLQTNGPGMPEVYEASKEKIRYIQGMPVKVTRSTESDGGGDGQAAGRLSVEYEDVWKAAVRKEDFDALILSVGIWPAKDAREVSGCTGINLDRHGFFAVTDPVGSGGFGVRTNKEGVFLAGACQKPKTIAEAIAHAEAAALAAISMLGAEVA